MTAFSAFSLHEETLSDVVNILQSMKQKVCIQYNELAKW